MGMCEGVKRLSEVGIIPCLVEPRRGPASPSSLLVFHRIQWITICGRLASYKINFLSSSQHQFIPELFEKGGDWKRKSDALDLKNI